MEPSVALPPEQLEEEQEDTEDVQENAGGNWNELDRLTLRRRLKWKTA